VGQPGHEEKLAAASPRLKIHLPTAYGSRATPGPSQLCARSNWKIEERSSSEEVARIFSQKPQILIPYEESDLDVAECFGCPNVSSAAAAQVDAGSWRSISKPLPFPTGGCGWSPGVWVCGLQTAAAPANSWPRCLAADG
jgi:hypothetical protein